MIKTVKRYIKRNPYHAGLIAYNLGVFAWQRLPWLTSDLPNILACACPLRSQTEPTPEPSRFSQQSAHSSRRPDQCWKFLLYRFRVLLSYFY